MQQTPANINLQIGKRMRCRRRQLGLTQREVGALLGVRFQQVQKYECAANQLSAAKLWAVAYALGVSVSYFFDAQPSERRDVHQWLN